ncbi:MAG TPA: thiol-disulfide isomerase, partial [Nitrososphaera sp.]|nr:thiol-disulfide isomerase [Nitrososphaera sp.]
GYIRYDHIGEGGYADTEKVIQSLLAEHAASKGANITIDKSVSNPQNAQSVDFGKINTPELYFGYQYARAPLGNPEGFKPDQVVKYTVPTDANNLTPNAIYLEGEWKNNADSMVLQSDSGRIMLIYSAKAANIVAGGHGQVQVSEDGASVTAKSRGSDVSEDGQLVINNQRLYNIAKHEQYGEHALVLDVKGGGFQIYTFTFG